VAHATSKKTTSFDFFVSSRMIIFTSSIMEYFNKEKEKKNTTSRGQYKKNAMLGLLSGLLILLAVNVLSVFLYFRLDLTSDHRHSLSSSTIQMLKNLEDKVYLKVYLKGKDYPADYQLFAKKVKDMLQDFRSYSDQVNFEFIDPFEDRNREEIMGILGEFSKKGLKAIPLTRENEAGFSTSSQVVVPGAIVTYKGRECAATLVMANPGDVDMLLSQQNLEYNLVTAIRQLIKPTRPKVAFLEGHGELDFLPTSWVAYQLSRLYQVGRVSIDGKINALREIAMDDTVKQTLKVKGNKYDLLIVAQPTKPFSEHDKFILDQHVMRGGKILWLVDATTASVDSLQTSQEFFATPRELHLNDLFFKYGVRLNANLLQDISCQSIPIIVGMLGDQPQYRLFAFPYALNVTQFCAHPITRSLKRLKIDFAGSIDLVGGGDLTKTVLMTTSVHTKMVPMPNVVTLNVVRTKPNPQEFAYRHLPLAVLVEGTFESAYNGILPVEFDTLKEVGFLKESVPTRQIFVSDGDVIRNHVDYKRNQPFPAGYDVHTGEQYDNSSFIMNCVNYLCADEDLLLLRDKNFNTGTLDSSKILSRQKWIAAANVSIPVLLIMLIGIAVWITRRVKVSSLKD
jgi:gliding-associated putative ABC transporter substrate-binding component GldG